MEILMKQIISTLQCLCTISFNIVIITQIHQDFYGNVPADNADCNVSDGVFNCESFKFKTTLARKTANSADRSSFVKTTKIVVPFNYLSNFWRSSEMPLTYFY